MFYLILAIVSSTLISLIMRTSERYRDNALSMLAINYITCLVLALFTTPWDSVTLEPVSLGLGSLQGFLYLTCFILLQYNISRNGIILSTTFMRLGVLVPTLCAIFLFDELPSVLQLIGFLLAILAIFLINGEKNSKPARAKWGLILLLLCGGTADVMSKLYEENGSQELKSMYILSTFVIASVLCTLLALVKKQHVTKKDLLCGIALGLPNYFAAVFLLNALHSVPAIIAYPTFSVSTIITVAICGLIFFHEKISRRQVMAIGLILISLLLLNI